MNISPRSDVPQCEPNRWIDPGVNHIELVVAVVQGAATARAEKVMASLCLLAEDGLTAERWELGDSPLAIGSDAAADIIIDDAALSRRHFLIAREANGYVLKDLGSHNGTWVDGRQAKSTRLHHHDCILAGRTLFMFNDTTASAAAGSLNQDPAGSAIKS